MPLLLMSKLIVEAKEAMELESVRVAVGEIGEKPDVSSFSLMGDGSSSGSGMGGG